MTIRAWSGSDTMWHKRNTETPKRRNAEMCEPEPRAQAHGQVCFSRNTLGRVGQLGRMEKLQKLETGN